MNKAIVTVKDIAEKAGVSTKTVERALSGVTLGMRKDARERAEKIKALAESMGYKPSRIAQSLQSGHTRQLGLLFNNITDQYFAAATEIAMDEAEKSDYSVQLQLMRFSPKREVECVNEMRSLGVDGIIFAGAPTESNRKYFKWLKTTGYPFITLGTSNSLGFPAIMPDHHESFHQAVSLLQAKGHRSIRLCLTWLAEDFRKILSSAFFEACEKYGITGEISCSKTSSELAAIPALKDTALIVYGKYSLRVFLDELEKIPQYQPDMVGVFNEWTWSSAPSHTLCGVIMEPAEQEIREGVRQLIGFIENRSDQPAPAISSKFYAEDEFDKIKAIDLSNRYLLAYPDLLQ